MKSDIDCNGVESSWEIPPYSCLLFCEHHSLLTSPYNVKSLVSTAVLHQFLTAIHERELFITSDNFHELSLFCDSFGFTSLMTRLARFQEK
jgi:hypothetical protein